MEVQTYGKGKPYTRIDPVTTQLSLDKFMEKLRELFLEYTHHIIPSWFLTNTKQELQKCRSARRNILFVTTDFAENIQVIRKYELADQFFHRIEILLFGAVASFVVMKGGEEEPSSHEHSYIVSCDYRSKDAQMVYVALQKCLLLAFESASAAGVTVKHIIHKVC